MLKYLFINIIFINNRFILINSFQIIIKFDFINFKLNDYRDKYFKNILIFDEYLFIKSEL